MSDGWLNNSTTLPPVCRYITTHNEHGTSIILSSPDQVYSGVPGAFRVARSFAVDNVPAKLEGEEDVRKYLSEDTEQSPSSRRLQDIVIANQRGINLTTVDLGPGHSIPMHRTVSIDFAICAIGQIDCGLDSGEIIHLKAGDHIIQRATMHKWINPSNSEPARLVVCIIPAESFDIGGGKMLEEVHLL